MRDHYERVFTILSDEGIGSPDDLLRYEPTAAYKSLPVLSSRRYPWVKHLVGEVTRSFEAVSSRWLVSPEPRLVCERMYHGLLAYSWKPNDPIFGLRARYGCVFPRRTLYLSYQFIRDEDGTDMLPPDYIPLALALKPLLQAELAYLLPTRVKFQGETFYDDGVIVDNYYARMEHQFAEIRGTGESLAELQERVRSEPLAEPIAQSVNFPWMSGGRIEDFVETASVNANEFDYYSETMTRFIRARESSPETVAAWLQELNYSFKRLDLTWTAKSRELTSKGIQAAVGVGATVGALLLPETFAAAKAAIAALAGSKAGIDAALWLLDNRNAKRSLATEPAWFLWSVTRR